MALDERGFRPVTRDGRIRPSWEPSFRAAVRLSIHDTAYESRGVVGFALTRSLVAQSAGVSSTG